MKNLLTTTLQTLEQDSIPVDNLNEVACFMVSMVLHFGLILPLLALWINVKSAEPETPPRVMMHLAGPRLAAHPATVSAGHAGGAGAHVPHRHHPKVSTPPPQHHQRPARPTLTTAPSLVPHSRPVQRPVAPSVPSEPTSDYPSAPEYPHGPTGQGRGNGRGEGRGDGQGKGPGQMAGLGQGQGAAAGGTGGNGQGVVEQGTMPLGFPRQVQVPEFLQKQEIRNWQVVILVTVDAGGNLLTMKVAKSSGVPGFDDLITNELKTMKWRPGTRNGVACESTLNMMFHGDLKLGTNVFTLAAQ